jgi:hypothetical protein
VLSMRETLLLFGERSESGLVMRRSSPKSLGRRNRLCGAAGLVTFALVFPDEVLRNVDAWDWGRVWVAWVLSTGRVILGAATLLAEAAVAGRYTPDGLTGDDADEVLGGSELPPVAL